MSSTPSFCHLRHRLPQLCRSGVVSPASLCIEPGKSAWVLYVDAMCINYDGNAFDATLLAMVAALKNSACVLPPSPSSFPVPERPVSSSPLSPLFFLPSCRTHPFESWILIANTMGTSARAQPGSRRRGSTKTASRRSAPARSGSPSCSATFRPRSRSGSSTGMFLACFFFPPFYNK